MSEGCEVPLEGASLDEEREILGNCHTVAVVGLSDKPHRDSHHVAAYLQGQGYRIIPVNPHVTEVLGEKAYARLRDVPDRVDVVDVFRRPEAVPEVVDDAIAVGARAVWMQEGVVNNAAAAKARSAGLKVVMNRCMLKEHRRLYRSERGE
jgi:predicted CoA-binding protein